MNIIEKKEKNLNQLISKLNSLTLTYSQPTHDVEKIITEAVTIENEFITGTTIDIDGGWLIS